MLNEIIPKNHFFRYFRTLATEKFIFLEKNGVTPNFSQKKMGVPLTFFQKIGGTP